MLFNWKQNLVLIIVAVSLAMRVFAILLALFKIFVGNGTRTFSENVIGKKKAHNKIQ